MDRLLRSRAGSHALLIAASAALPAAVVHTLAGEDRAPVTPSQHLVVMVISCSIAAIASATLMRAGFVRRDTRAVVAGGAFAAITLILAIHAIATPGVLFGDNGVVAVAGGFALPTGATILALAALPALRGPRHLRAVTLALSGLLVAIAVLGAAALAFPAAVPVVPDYGSPAAVALLAAGLAIFALVASRAVRTYTLTRRRADLVVVVGIVWLGCALVPALTCETYTWRWWCGHALELLGVALVGVPVALDVHRGRPSRPLVGDLRPAALVADEEVFLGAHVGALLGRLARKDRSTEQHTRRVAELAVAIGERMGLAPGRLRDLALAGLLHDIGKLSTPDAILGKPGALTDAEMDVIRRHPADGDALLAQLGQAPRIRRIVRGHHERLDGSGYPDGLAGDALDLETRIMAVADVWDALVSPRVYRGAWTPERAMALLAEEAGTAFDPRCVAALQQITGVAAPTAQPSAPLADVA